MDTVKWAHSTGLGPDDLMLSDSLLDLVKDEDIVSEFEPHDDILPQGVHAIYGIFSEYFRFSLSILVTNSICFF